MINVGYATVIQAIPHLSLQHLQLWLIKALAAHGQLSHTSKSEGHPFGCKMRNRACQYWGKYFLLFLQS